MVTLLFWVATFFAEIVGSIAGFGSSTLLLPISLFFFDFKTALVLVAIFHVSGSLGRAHFFRTGIDKKILFAFGIPTVLFTILGALLVNYVSPELLKLLLGVFLVVFSSLSLASIRLTLKVNRKNMVFGGAISGFISGLIGTGGPSRTAFLTAFDIKKVSYLGTSAIIALVVDAARIPIYLKNGFLPSQYYLFVPILFVLAIFASFVAKQVVDKLPQKTFKKLVLIAVLLAGIKLAYDGIMFFL